MAFTLAPHISLPKPFSFHPTHPNHSQPKVPYHSSYPAWQDPQGTWTPLCSSLSSVSFSRQYVLHPIPLPLLPGVHSILYGNRALASRAMETTLSRLCCRHQTSFGGDFHCQMRDSSQHGNAFIHLATGLSRSKCLSCCAWTWSTGKHILKTFSPRTF